MRQSSSRSHEGPKPGKRLASGPARQGKKRRRGLTVLAVLALGLALLALGLRIYVRPPSQTLNTPPQSGQPSQPGSAQNPDGPGDIHKPNAYTCLLVGQRDGMTDTLMVAMLDLDAKTAGVVSIPRDTVVEVSRRVPKINGAYSAGGAGDAGIAQLLQEMSTVIGYTPGNYVMVNMKGFVALVDEIGGVEFDVPVRMYKQWEGIDLRPGLQRLSGDKALQLVRFRGYGQSAAQAGIDHDDYGRMQVQQMFLKALIEQTLTLENIGKIPALVGIAGKNMKTDMDAGNIAWYAEQLLKLDRDSITFATLPTHSVNYSGAAMAGGYYEIVDSQAALELVNRLINPFTDAITAPMVRHIDPE